MADIILGNLYDFNKQAYGKEKPLDIIALQNKVGNMIKDIFTEAKSTTWMLLCKERSDYTVFILLTTTGSIKEMVETLLNRGEVLDIEKQKDGNYEIWIRDPETKENFAYYFFDYTFGIVKA